MDIDKFLHKKGMKPNQTIEVHLNGDKNRVLIIGLKDLLKQYKQALNLTDVVATLPNINSSVFKNWLKVNKYAETMNRLVYSKKDWDYDIDVLYRAFTNEIEFGN